jgi:SHS2 domain-containing protein
MTAEKFEILEHTGDVKIQAFGRTKEELFLNAMLGMMTILKPRIIGQQGFGVRKIKVSSPDLNALLVDFLNEVNYLVQTNKEVYNKARFIKFSDTEIEAEIFSQKAEAFGEEIKAVTHHGLDIKQTQADSWEATILFDI